MNVNEITITMASNWYIDRTVRQKIGYSGENAVVEFKLEATPEEGFTYYLDVQSKKIKNIILLDDELSVTLTTEMLGEAGIKKMQIVAYNETQVKKSNIFEVEVGESINATEEVEGHFASALNQISEWIAGVYRALTGKQNKLVPGANVAIDETDPEHPVISVTGGGAGGTYLNGDGLNLTGNVFSVKPKTNGGIIVDNTGVSLDPNLLPTNNIIAPVYYRENMSIKSNMTYDEIYEYLAHSSTSIDSTECIIPQFIDDQQDERFDCVKIKETTRNNMQCIMYVFRHWYVYSDDDATTAYDMIIYHYEDDTIGTSGGYHSYTLQKKLTSTNAGSGISIIDDANGNPVISVNYPNGDEVSY